MRSDVCNEQMIYKAAKDHFHFVFTLVWDFMTNSILFLLHLPDDRPTIPRKSIFSTALQASSEHCILMIFTNVFQTFEAVLPHTITHSNLSFKQRTSTTDKRIYSISVYMIREDTSNATPNQSTDHKELVEPLYILV